MVSGKSNTRPGRKIAAEKRRVAREVLVNFCLTDEFFNLPGYVKAALRTLCPEIIDMEKLATSSFDFISHKNVIAGGR